MQFSLKFSALLVALIGICAAPYPESTSKPALHIISTKAMMHWLATTDAELTFIGKPINLLLPPSLQSTMVTYCSTVVETFCGRRCTVYNGGATCLDAPDTNCLTANHNVAFCSNAMCGGICNTLASCGTPLDNGACYTPGTRSITVDTF